MTRVPSVHTGLADAVENRVPVDDIIRTTTNPRLCLVDAGEAAVARRPALAGSKALVEVFEELEGRFDHLLLDLPPVLATSEAMNLSQLADSYALVVRQGATSEAQVEAALEEMQGASGAGRDPQPFRQPHPDAAAAPRRHLIRRTWR